MYRPLARSAALSSSTILNASTSSSSLRTFFVSSVHRSAVAGDPSKHRGARPASEARSNARPSLALGEDHPNSPLNALTTASSRSPTNAGSSTAPTTTSPPSSSGSSLSQSLGEEAKEGLQAISDANPPSSPSFDPPSTSSQNDSPSVLPLPATSLSTSFGGLTEAQARIKRGEEVRAAARKGLSFPNVPQYSSVPPLAAARPSSESPSRKPPPPIRAATAPIPSTAVVRVSPRPLPLLPQTSPLLEASRSPPPPLPIPLTPDPLSSSRFKKFVRRAIAVTAYQTRSSAEESAKLLPSVADTVRTEAEKTIATIVEEDWMQRPDLIERFQRQEKERMEKKEEKRKAQEEGESVVKPVQKQPSLPASPPSRPKERQKEPAVTSPLRRSLSKKGPSVPTPPRSQALLETSIPTAIKPSLQSFPNLSSPSRRPSLSLSLSSASSPYTSSLDLTIPSSPPPPIQPKARPHLPSAAVSPPPVPEKRTSPASLPSQPLSSSLSYTPSSNRAPLSLAFSPSPSSSSTTSIPVLTSTQKQGPSKGRRPRLQAARLQLVSTAEPSSQEPLDYIPQTLRPSLIESASERPSLFLAASTSSSSISSSTPSSSASPSSTFLLNPTIHFSPPPLVQPNPTPSLLSSAVSPPPVPEKRSSPASFASQSLSSSLPATPSSDRNPLSLSPIPSSPLASTTLNPIPTPTSKQRPSKRKRLELQAAPLQLESTAEPLAERPLDYLPQASRPPLTEFTPRRPSISVEASTSSPSISSSTPSPSRSFPTSHIESHLLLPQTSSRSSPPILASAPASSAPPPIPPAPSSPTSTAAVEPISSPPAPRPSPSPPETIPLPSSSARLSQVFSSNKSAKLPFHAPLIKPPLSASLNNDLILSARSSSPKADAASSPPPPLSSSATSLRLPSTSVAASPSLSLADMSDAELEAEMERRRQARIDRVSPQSTASPPPIPIPPPRRPPITFESSSPLISSASASSSSIQPIDLSSLHLSSLTSRAPSTAFERSPSRLSSKPKASKAPKPKAFKAVKPQATRPTLAPPVHDAILSSPTPFSPFSPSSFDPLDTSPPFSTAYIPPIFARAPTAASAPSSYQTAVQKRGGVSLPRKPSPSFLMPTPGMGERKIVPPFVPQVESEERLSPMKPGVFVPSFLRGGQQEGRKVVGGGGFSMLRQS